MEETQGFQPGEGLDSVEGFEFNGSTLAGAVVAVAHRMVASVFRLGDAWEAKRAGRTDVSMGETLQKEATGLAFFWGVALAVSLTASALTRRLRMGQKLATFCASVLTTTALEGVGRMAANRGIKTGFLGLLGRMTGRQLTRHPVTTLSRPAAFAAHNALLARSGPLVRRPLPIRPVFPHPMLRI